MKRVLLIAVCLFAVFSSLYVVADHLGYTDEAFVQERLAAMRASSHGPLLVAGVIIGLLTADLLLPVPSSVVMTISGKVFGIWLGAMVSFIGALLAAVTGFLLCRWGGQRTFQRLLGADDVEAVDRWFRTYGVYAIVLSRPVPMLTEVLSCLAGLTDMAWPVFLMASVLGTAPICLVYGYFGHVSSAANPWPAACAALLIPALGWILVRHIKRDQPAG